MKTIFTIFLCLPGFTVLFAQEQPAAVIHESNLDTTFTDSTIIFYTYTATDKPGTTTTQRLDDSGNWQNQVRSVYSYDNADRLTQIMTSDWSVGEQAWLDARRNTITYTPSGQRAINLLQTYGTNVWGDNEWYNYNREIWHYSTEEMADSMSFMMWNADTWESTYKWVYTWNGDLLMEDVFFVFAEGVWKLNSKINNTYTAFDAPEVATRYLYTDNTWVPFDRHTYDYNGEQLSMIRTEFYNAGPGMWIYAYRRRMDYHADGILHQQIYEVYDGDNNPFIVLYRDTYFYGPYALGFGEEAFAIAEVFPNPTQADVQIRFEQATVAELILTDLQGKTLSATAVSGMTATVSLSALPAGTYLLNVTNGSQSATKRIVKH